MSEEYPREVVIGDQKYLITRFKGLKATLAGALVSRVMREIPELQERVNTFRKTFRETNTIVITPAMAKLPRFSGLGLTEEDFRVSGGKVEFPEEPESGAILVHVFPDLFDLADKELRRFLALILIPNSELFEADDADDVNGALDKWGKRILREGDIEELIELVIVGTEVLREQMARKRERLGKLQIPILQALLGQDQEEEPTEEKEPQSDGLGETLETLTETDPSPTSNSEPDSSTPSPEDSGGTEEPSLETSLGTN